MTGSAIAMAITAAVFVAGISVAARPAPAADPSDQTAQVDLRDKKGIVDPKDLKKHDPKPQPLRTKEPPPPKVGGSPSADPPKNPPSDEGGKPGPGATPVRPAPSSSPPPRYVPPPKPPAKR